MCLHLVNDKFNVDENIRLENNRLDVGNAVNKQKCDIKHRGRRFQ